MAREQIDGFAKEAAPICVFCNARWTDEMVNIEARSGGGGCDTCGMDGEANYRVEIKCHSCKRVIYIKEGYGD